MKTVISEAYKKHSAFLLSIPRLLESGEGVALKEKRNVVRLMSDGDEEFVVKRYKRVNLIQSIIYTFFRRTKAERAYLFATEFRRRGVASPGAVAYMEMKERGLFRTGYFISEVSKGQEAFFELVKKEPFNRELADAVTDHIVLMHSRGVLHGDMNSANFLYTRDAEGKYSFDMIDTNRSRFTDGWPTREQCLENLKRFTHRRDLYEYVVRGYARRRGWDEESTLSRALQLLEHFENRKKLHR